MVRIISVLILAATAACALAQDKPQLVDNPPDRHIVVAGDTLWGISGKFLKQPWQWPTVWRLNKEQIKNPHRIFPGDIVVLDLSSGNPQLKIARPVRVQPQIYSEPVKKEIYSIPANVIEPWLAKPLIVEGEALNDIPRFVATQEDKVFMGVGDIGYAEGITDTDVLDWSVYRPGKPLHDPETKEILGYEAFDLGTARLLKPGSPATLRIVTAREEMTRGSRLIPTPKSEVIAYVPHAPDASVDARIVSIYAGMHSSGRLSVVTINQGNRDGLEVGHVLALKRRLTAYDYNEKGNRVAISLPDERYGLVFVFRTFERISYALVMESDRHVVAGDVITNP